MKSLIGHKILAIQVSNDQYYLRFFTESELEDIIYYEVDGDCCSDSWWADFINVSFLIGETVIDVVEVSLPDQEDGRTRQEYDNFYGFDIRTRQGIAALVFRNSSNGYYGGSYNRTYANTMKEREAALKRKIIWIDIGPGDWSA